MDKLKIIKIIVYFLTFLLIFGSLVLLGSLYKKTHTPKDIPLHEIRYNLDQPRGSTISQYTFDKPNLYILVKNGGLSDRIIIYNTEKAQITGTVQIN